MSNLQYTVRVLGIHEDDQWCAIALEMSLRGYGETFEAALDDLHDAIEAQVSFAIQHDTLDSIWTPAEPHYVELYNETRRHSLRRYFQGEETTAEEEHKLEYAAGDLPLPRSERGGFEAVA